MNSTPVAPTARCTARARDDEQETEKKRMRKANQKGKTDIFG